MVLVMFSFLFVAAFWVAAIFLYVRNLTYLIEYFFDNQNFVVNIFRVVGVFVPFIGMVMGLFEPF
jgi:hypothetical protein